MAGACVGPEEVRMQEGARGLKEAAGSCWRSAGSVARAVAFYFKHVFLLLFLHNSHGTKEIPTVEI